MDIVKNVKTDEVMPEVPIRKLRRLVEKTKNLDDESGITLQFVLMNLFPVVWNNIEKYAKDCYTNGYLQGLKDGKDGN